MITPRDLTVLSDQELIDRLLMTSDDPLVQRLLRIIGEQQIWSEEFPDRTPSDILYDFDQYENEVANLQHDVDELSTDLHDLRSRKVSELVAELERTVEHKDHFIQGQSNQNRELRDQLQDAREKLDSWSILNRV
jgi:hypothetical protein